MKNKCLGVGLAFAIGLFASTSAVNAQIGGESAYGNTDASGASSGEYGKTDYRTTNRGATPLWDPRAQNYTSTTNEHSHVNIPLVRQMEDSDMSGLARTNTAPMAPGTVNMAPINSGGFSYGFNTTQRGAFPLPYTGAYASGSRGVGPALPQVSTGSVDINTVDNSGFVPYGSPMPMMSSPINSANQMLNSIPSAASSAASVYNWLQNGFFGP